MNLHEGNEALSEFVQLAAENFGLPQVYVEKDYWATKSLKHLSESAHVDDVVFKGGASLSKAYRLLHRFSEDIDLAVFKGDKSNNALKNQIKDVETVVTQSLTYLEDDEQESKGSKFRKTVYQYPRSIDGVIHKVFARTQAFGWAQAETNSTNSRPCLVKRLSIASKKRPSKRPKLRLTRNSNRSMVTALVKQTNY